MAQASPVDGIQRVRLRTTPSGGCSYFGRDPTTAVKPLKRERPGLSPGRSPGV